MTHHHHLVGGTVVFHSHDEFEHGLEVQVRLVDDARYTYSGSAEECRNDICPLREHDDA